MVCSVSKLWQVADFAETFGLLRPCFISKVARDTTMAKLSNFDRKESLRLETKDSPRCCTLCPSIIERTVVGSTPRRITVAGKAEASASH